MKGFVITIAHNTDSERSAGKCIESAEKLGCEIDIDFYMATTPETVSNIRWTWPLRKKATCPHTGLRLSAYKNVDIQKRIACAESHYRLWKHCVDLDEEILVLEHDAIFTRKFKPFEHTYDAVSLNTPIKATFKGNEYDNKLQEGISDVPYVADEIMPQGLPGHSAYLITPQGASKVIELQDRIGWWPNDAIMCKQLMPNIGCAKPYYTNLQNIKSSTVN